MFIVNVLFFQLICVLVFVSCFLILSIGKYYISFSILCIFGGDLFFDVIWIKFDGMELKYYNYDNLNYEVFEIGVFIIKLLDVDDDGQWMVQVNNVKKYNVVNM